MRKNDLKFFAAGFMAILAAALLLTSCAGSELKNTVFVTSAGVALEKNVYSVALYGNAAAQNGEESISAFGSGRTLSEALNAARIDCQKELFLGHCEKIAVNSAALRDASMLSAFADSVVSPACKVYFSDSPETGAENIPGEGFSSELYKLSVCAKNGTPAVIPTAEDPARTAVITADETFLLDSEDSFGIMLLRDEAYPRTITVALSDSFETVKLSPEAKRKAYFSDGILTVEAEISLNAENCSEKARRAASQLSEKICRSAFEKTVNVMGIDSVNISTLTRYNRQQLKTARLILRVD